MKTIRLHVDDFSEEEQQELLEQGVLEEAHPSDFLGMFDRTYIDGRGYWSDGYAEIRYFSKNADEFIYELVNFKVEHVELCYSIYTRFSLKNYELEEVYGGKIKIPNQLKITIGQDND